MVEFYTNNATSETTKVSPFLANMGFNPRLDFTLWSPITSLDMNISETFAYLMNNVHNYLKAEIHFVLGEHEQHARSASTSPPNLRVGTEVWLSVQNIRTARPNRKLDWKRLGQFTIKTIVSSYAYEPALPSPMKIHPVFHISLLKPVGNNSQPGQIIPQPPPVVVAGENEYSIDEILDSRFHWKKLEYLVMWTGYNAPTWEPVDNMEHDTTTAINTLHSLFPLKLRHNGYITHRCRY